MIVSVERPAVPGVWNRVIAWGGGSGGRMPVFDRRQRLILLAVFGLLLMLRVPGAWRHGRFLGEEGSIFFAYGWHRPAGVALFRSFGGYWNLGANATTLLAVKLVKAGLLSLTLAPYLTMALALLCQMIPGLLILTGRGSWLADRWAVLASLLVIVGAPMTEEVFVNVLHIQFHLALCTALILALDIPGSKRGRIGYGILLFLAPLCGPGAIVMVPLFALRSMVDRRRARLVQTAALVAGAGLQLAMFFVPSPLRGQFLDPVTLAAIMFVRLFVLPILTSPVADPVGRLIYLTFEQGVARWLAAAAALGYFGIVAAAALRHRRDAASWLILSALAIGAVSFGGGMLVLDRSDWFSTRAGERYNFLPLVLLTLGLIALALRSTGRARRAWIGLVAMTLLSGAIVYPTPIGEVSRGPDWPNEVAIWRRDHQHPLVSWPAAWTIDLSDRDRPCSPPLPIGGAPQDPNYCESAWLAHVARRIQSAHDLAQRK